jgi:hypothetical protein
MGTQTGNFTYIDIAQAGLAQKINDALEESLGMAIQEAIVEDQYHI